MADIKPHPPTAAANIKSHPPTTAIRPMTFRERMIATTAFAASLGLNVADGSIAEIDAEPPPRRGKGRPGIKDTALSIYAERRAQKASLGASGSEEADRILARWPKRPKRPIAKTVAGYIAERWKADDKMR